MKRINLHLVSTLLHAEKRLSITIEKTSLPAQVRTTDVLRSIIKPTPYSSVTQW